MAEWQPIDTAPKDGTWILVFGHRYMDEHLPPFGMSRWIEESREEWVETSATTRKLRGQGRLALALRDGRHADTLAATTRPAERLRKEDG